MLTFVGPDLWHFPPVSRGAALQDGEGGTFFHGAPQFWGPPGALPMEEARCSLGAERW